MSLFDPADAHARLDAISARLEELRAAVLTAEEGDPTALTTIGETVDTMAADLAVLRTAGGGAEFA